MPPVTLEFNAPSLAFRAQQCPKNTPKALAMATTKTANYQIESFDDVCDIYLLPSLPSCIQYCGLSSRSFLQIRIRSCSSTGCLPVLFVALLAKSSTQFIRSNLPAAKTTTARCPTCLMLSAAPAAVVGKALRLAITASSTYGRAFIAQCAARRSVWWHF